MKTIRTNIPNCSQIPIFIFCINSLSRIFTTARDHRTPVVSVSGGGYAEPISLSVTAYLNTLKVLREVFEF